MTAAEGPVVTAPSYQAAEAFERALGDPMDAAAPFSFRQAVALDEQEAFPEEACRLIEAQGFHRYYVPAGRGGAHRSSEQLLAMSRAIPRRDLTAAIAHCKTFLGGMPVWMAGDEAQQARAAAAILAGGQVALAVTERDHGSDLLACETRAEPDGAGGYLLNGEKWLINNGTRAAALVVLARTGPAGDPRGCSLFLVEKAELAPGCFSHLPKVRTHGIRGADISGVRFDQCPLPGAARLGAEGTGLETLLRVFHATRVMLTGLSLGAADTALRCVLDFTLGRRLYGATAFDIPAVRQELIDAFADLLAGECAAIAAARALDATPADAGLWSAFAKAFVPPAVDDAVRRLGDVLGARSYLREEHWWGIYEKLARDHRLVSLFDGCTAVNLEALGLHLRHRERWQARLGPGEQAAMAGRLAEVFALDRPLLPFQPARVGLYSRGRDDVLHGLPLTLARLQAAPGIEEPVRAAVLAGGARVLARLAALPADTGESRSAATFAAAREYCRLYAAATCLHLWAHSCELLDGYFAAGSWLALVLARLLGEPLGPPVAADEAAARLLALYQQGRLFSLVPIRLAGSPDAAG